MVVTGALRPCVPSSPQYLVAHGVMSALGTLTPLASRHSEAGALSAVLSDVLMVAVIVVFMWALLASGHRAARREARKRDAAAAGDTARVPLADEQPDPIAASARLPLVIQLWPRWSRVVVAGALFPVILELFGLLLVLLSRSSPFDAFVLPLPAVLALVVPAAGLLAYVSARMRIEATDEGLTVIPSAGGIAQRISWDEARVFAIAPARRLRTPFTYYQLADSRTVVKWVRLPRSSHFSLLDAASLSKPATSFEEYNRQMDALRSLIAAKTGLSLYDLRRARPETR